MRALLVLTLLLLPACAAAQQSTPLATEKDKVSYALGMDLGKQLKAKQVQVDPAVFSRGLADALAGSKLQLTDEEARKLVSALQDEMQRREFAAIAAEADKNRRAGEAFLAANNTKEGIVTLPSGVQYRVLKAGSGRTPKPDDSVVCHYKGAFIDGTEFENSYTRGEPATIQIKNALKGWTEVLPLMPLGSRWQIFIPSDLAYGSRGAGSKIPPNTTLVFEVELVGIK